MAGMGIRRLGFTVLSVVALVGAASVTGQNAAAAPDPSGGSGLEVYVGNVTPGGVEEMRQLGVDPTTAAGDPGPAGTVEVEAVLSEAQVAKLRKAGVRLNVKKVDGVAASEALRRQAVQGWDAFRPYSGTGGIRDELVATVAAHRGIAKLVDLGATVNGQRILAVKVTKDATKVKDGKRPAVLYASAQHAREWITPEMTRRLMHHFIDGYGKDRQITALVDTTELWFLPVANPDGYDFTFTEGNRLWRKNVRDNNGDGQITVGDGIDLNRNFAVKWGYDNEGSSPDPASDTYRGTGPNSEPETKALDGLFKRAGFEFFVNYHSAAELLLYGIGWQVDTPSPDDVIYEAMVGTDENPAVPGYDPVPRRREIPKRDIAPDPLYDSPLVSKFINCVMSDGKRSTAERILYRSFDIIKEKTGDDPLKVFKKAIDNVKPSLEVKSRRVGGSNYQVPVEVNPNRRLSLSLRWIVGYATARGDGKTMQEKLANELMDAANLRGGAVKKREDTHRMAEANKAFAHYRW